MENKEELRDKILEATNDIWNGGLGLSHNKIDAILEKLCDLADKQGYMRGVEYGVWTR